MTEMVQAFIAIFCLIATIGGFTITVMVLIDRRVRRLQGKIPTPPPPRGFEVMSDDLTPPGV